VSVTLQLKMIMVVLLNATDPSPHHPTCSCRRPPTFAGGMALGTGIQYNGPTKYHIDLAFPLMKCLQRVVHFCSLQIIRFHPRII
jgi:hypothetical protein